MQGRPKLSASSTAADLEAGIEPAAASEPGAYRIRSGAIMIVGGADFDEVLQARFGSPNGEVIGR